jgi:hypothetical protein
MGVVVISHDRPHATDASDSYTTLVVQLSELGIDYEDAGFLAKAFVSHGIQTIADILMLSMYDYAEMKIPDRLRDRVIDLTNNRPRWASCVGGGCWGSATIK